MCAGQVFEARAIQMLAVYSYFSSHVYHTLLVGLALLRILRLSRVCKESHILTVHDAHLGTWKKSLHVSYIFLVLFICCRAGTNTNM